MNIDIDIDIDVSQDIYINVNHSRESRRPTILCGSQG